MLMAISCDALALKVVRGKVVVLEHTYMPGKMLFSLDSGIPLCPANTWLTWANASEANNRITYASLLAALQSQRDVEVYFNDEGPCTAVYLHVM